MKWQQMEAMFELRAIMFKTFTVAAGGVMRAELTLLKLCDQL